MAKPKVPKEDYRESGLGYPKIEELIEYENFEEVNKSFSESYEKLEKLKKNDQKNNCGPPDTR